MSLCIAVDSECIYHVGYCLPEHHQPIKFQTMLRSKGKLNKQTSKHFF